MTNEEAIKLIQGIEEDVWNLTSEDVEALDLAIKALEEERPQGEWITDSVGNITCSNCGFSLGSKVIKLVYPFDFPYCPDCGAKMKGGAE